jgi:uncharacterized membrane protein YdbT with pleckstrin-like domain
MSGIVTAVVGADMSPANPANLLSDEKVVFRARIHWWAAYGLTVVVGAAGLLVMLLAALVGATSAVIGLFVFAAIIAVVVGLYGFLRMRATEFVLTNRRITAKRGLLNRHSIETLLDRVEGMSVHQDVFGSWLGFGTLIIHGVGGTKEPMPYVAQPHAVRAALQQQLTGWQRRS